MLQKLLDMIFPKRFSRLFAQHVARLLPPKASLSGECYCTVTKTMNYVTELEECHGDDTSLTFYDTPPSLFSAVSVNLILMTPHDTFIEIGLN